MIPVPAAAGKNTKNATVHESCHPEAKPKDLEFGFFPPKVAARFVHSSRRITPSFVANAALRMT